MKFEQSKNRMKLFSQIECSHLSKAKSLLSVFLFVAFVTLLTVPVQAAPHGSGQPADTFRILLSGPYKPVAQGHGPDLGLTTVDLSDGSFSTTRYSLSAGCPKTSSDMEMAQRRNRSETFTYSSRVCPLPTTSPVDRYRWFSRAAMLKMFPMGRVERTL
jgi:hypothetical protein